MRRGFVSEMGLGFLVVKNGRSYRKAAIQGLRCFCRHEQGQLFDFDLLEFGVAFEIDAFFLAAAIVACALFLVAGTLFFCTFLAAGIRLLFLLMLRCFVAIDRLDKERRRLQDLLAEMVRDQGPVGSQQDLQGHEYVQDAHHLRKGKDISRSSVKFK